MKAIIDRPVIQGLISGLFLSNPAILFLSISHNEWGNYYHIDLKRKDVWRIHISYLPGFKIWNSISRYSLTEETARCIQVLFLDKVFWKLREVVLHDKLFFLQILRNASLKGELSILSCIFYKCCSDVLCTSKISSTWFFFCFNSDCGWTMILQWVGK